MTIRTINVSTAAQVAAAIAGATGGETIVLAAGSYGALTIKSRSLASLVTIKSADLNNEAVISDLRVSASSNFRFQDLELHRPLKTGEADFTQAAYISSSSNIQIAGMRFTGSLDGNAANDGTGLRIASSQNVSLTGSSFEQWKNAVILSDTKGLTVSGNTLTGVVKTFDLTGISNATFADNHFVGVKAGWNEAGFAGQNVVFQNNSVAGLPTAAVSTAVDTGAGKVISVATTAQLTAAIAAVKGGETILLAPGEYGQLTINARNVTSTVTIRSADPNNDATLTSVRVSNSSNFTFNDVDVHRVLKTGEADFTQAVYVSGSKAINFIGVDFSGSLDNNAWNDGVGLRVSSSSNVAVLDSTFRQWNNAAVFDGDVGLVVAGNSVREVREGFDFAAITNGVVDRNFFTAFQPNYAKGDHSDSIQFWNQGVPNGSSHIVISNNIMLHGASGGVQGIFVMSSDPVLRHSDVTIENNLYNGDARHGITLNATDGAVVRGNTVTSAPGGMLEAGININNDSNVVIEKNVAPLLLAGGGNTGLQWKDNTDLWDGHLKVGTPLSAIFDGPTPGVGTNLASFAIKAGSVAALAHAGFVATAGIGADAFDLMQHAAYGNLDARLTSYLG